MRQVKRMMQFPCKDNWRCIDCHPHVFQSVNSGLFFEIPVPANHLCLANDCRMGRHNIIHTRAKREIARWYKRPGICDKVGVIRCPMPIDTNCKGHCWNKWSVTVDWGQRSRNTTIFYDLQVLPERPFLITSVLQHNQTNKIQGLQVHPSNTTRRYLDVVSFFLPNLPEIHRCNQVYCIYNHTNNQLEGYAGRPVDVSLVQCPYPTKIPSSTTTITTALPSISLRLTYDHVTFSAPFEIVPEKIESPEIELKHVDMMICAIVKAEGGNLKEWIEFHRMMGYERIVLYDNNFEPDELMDSIIGQYPDVVIRRPWRLRHAQTEAMTDCILRYKYTATWASIVDVDEFIVPATRFDSMKAVLETQLRDKPYLQANWVTFGPCPNDTAVDGLLSMERCRNITFAGSQTPKATFQMKMAAAMQGYGPHFVLLTEDVGISARSTGFLADEYFRIYHYRYKTWAEFMTRRVGDIAGLSESWIPKGLEQSWAKGIRNQQVLLEEDNHILRFIPELRRRLGLE
eukprot:TRINITY_DN5831_c0_g1_i1.p1 TRINITY_DN5831_c0_g1~~TRINITY_DN5831_c0_g1_i1.p1  ORF type:complete len:514 (-),score=67.25 TRINITY_DN5831_c0_g1_i1:535-2076(-)